MSNAPDPAPAPDDAELLLPWLATGRLAKPDRRQLQARVEQDAELARRLGIVRDELGETIRLNEALGAPSPRAAEVLFGLIDAAPARPVSLGQRIAAAGARLTRRLDRPSPRGLAWAAGVALLLIVAEGGGLAALLTGHTGSAGYSTASGPAVPAGTGAFALVRFAPAAPVADVTQVLQSFGATIVEGPNAGFYRVRVSDTPLSPAALDEILGRLRQTSAVIQLALPAS